MSILKTFLKIISKNKNNKKIKNIDVFFTNFDKNNNLTFSEKVDSRLLRFDTSNKETLSKLINSIDNIDFDYFVSTDVNLIKTIKRIKKNINIISDIKKLTDEEIIKSRFLLFFHTDDLYFNQVERILKLNAKLSIFKIWGDKNFGSFKFFWGDSNALLAINDRLKIDRNLDNLWTKKDYYSNKTFKELGLQLNIIQALSMTKDLEGAYVEVGVLAGSSLLTALNFIKRTNLDRMSYGLDTYEGFTYDKANVSSVSYWKNTHKLGDSKEVMKKISLVLNTTKQNFKLFKCDICKKELPNEISKIAVGYIDVDMFEPTQEALIKISQKIVKNGVIICEDPTSTPGLLEAYMALKLFLNTKEGCKYSVITLSNVYLLIKNKS